jgi:prolyl-tRNA synthetase
MTMGCYGIGVSRIVAAAIEQNHDENGIIWPNSIAPFDVAIAPINMQKSEDVSAAAIKLHDDLTAAGLDVLLYDEKARLGGMLADLDLIGIPHRIVIGDRGLKENKVEYKKRDAEESQDISIDQIVSFLTG